MSPYYPLPPTHICPQTFKKKLATPPTSNQISKLLIPADYRQGGDQRRLSDPRFSISLMTYSTEVKGLGDWYKNYNGQQMMYGDFMQLSKMDLGNVSSRKYFR